jgi:hypothetical protein
MAGLPTITFGRGLLIRNGDLALEAGDFAPVEGRDNFSQGLQMIIETPFGSDPVNVNYGFDLSAVFSRPNTTAAVKDILRLNIVKSLSQDDRVREIGEIVFDDEPRFAAIAPEFAGGDTGKRARATRQWHAVVTFTTIAGEAQRIALSGAQG